MKPIDDDLRARLLVLISREEMDFIDNIGKDAMFSTGHKLSHTDIVSVVLDVIASLPITGKDIRSKEELRSRIIKTIEEKVKDTNKRERR